ncbi:DNA/RNA non-specific endonuclease [Streptomyces sp. NPDC091371]|uniref:DNA/RNA non-specific endonuclease n=1 Tax=Streptomyces sp. NPDC091371 TaxID=3155303 RepID=UPI00344241CB
MLTGATPVLVHNCGPVYSEIVDGRRGVAYAEVSPQTLADASARRIGSEPGTRKPHGFRSGVGDSRGHLIGRQFGGDGHDMRNIIVQGGAQNNGAISTAEDVIAAHVRSSGNTIIMSVTPIYGAAKYRATHVRIEAVDDFGWSFDSGEIPNF